ncbi:hypothetical protein LSCM1_07318 [Leishmania martiniquensis]|uniref:Sel1 repeat family protein n=1 Tax=Leishmania martiniquensis TaxID=1580590 RepID=A0A836HRE7_9TRYP|nr:hypothetical protein LSCM1_07318 [Leishmania martiniquensis]
MDRYCVLRQGRRGGQVRRSLSWSFAATVGALAILASVTARAVLAEVEDDASWQSVDTRGSGVSDAMANASAARVNEPHASAVGAALTLTGGFPQGGDDTASRPPEALRSHQEHHKQGAGHTGELYADTVSIKEAVESDTAVASTPPSPPPSEASTAKSVVVEDDRTEPPLEEDVPARSVSHGAPYSGEEGGRLHEQRRMTELTATAPSPVHADGTSGTDVRDTCAAAVAKEPAAASYYNAGQDAAAARSPNDIVAPSHPRVLPAFDEAAASTSAWGKGSSPALPRPQAEAPKWPPLEDVNAPRQWSGSGEAGGGRATHDVDGATADDRVLSGIAGSSSHEVCPAETPLPEAELAAERLEASAAPSADAMPAEVPGIEHAVGRLEEDDGPSAVKAAYAASEEARAEERGRDDLNFSVRVPMPTRTDDEAAAYARSREGHAAPSADVYPPRQKEEAVAPAEAAAQSYERPDGTAAADVAFTGEAEIAAKVAAFDLDEDEDDRVGEQGERLESSSPASATITAPSGRDTARYHPNEQHRLRSRSSPPSRLALSYLYYHALEALYVEENITLFVQRARDMAPYGHARLNWLLGVLHAYGVGVPHSERDALMYYSFAAMEAVPEAHMALGYRYKLGLGVVESCESALAHYREAADAVAMTYDGTAAASVDGVTAMTAGAKTIGSGKGGRSGSTSFFAYRDDAAASDMRQERRLDMMGLKYQADIGNVNALLTLGYLLLKGDYQVMRNGRRAAAYFETAAEKGSARAHGALGQLYMAGDPSISPPLLPDLQRALHHFRLGALQNDPLSLNGIGFLHAIGYLYQDKRQGVTGNNNTTGAPGISDEAAESTSNGPPDFVTASQYFYRSHCAEGLYNLGVLFLHGRGVALDKKQARRLFEKAAKQGSVLAQWQLANMLSEAANDGSGIGVAECERALALYQRTASFGTWQHRASGNLRSGGGTDVGASDAGMGPQSQRHGQAEGRTGAGVEGDARLLERAGARHLSSRDGSPDEGDGPGADGGGDASHLDELVRPRSEAEYQLLVTGLIDRLHAVEEALVLSDEGEGPTTVSLASFVELLSLAETGDAAAPWLAAQYVDEYLEVADATLRGGRRVGENGAVPLLWPSTSAPGETSEYLSGEAATSELLYHLLQRTVLHHTHSHATLGAAYLRLGNFYYYGESPLYGVDMERALAYYRIAGDHHYNAQALFNVGFMYQLGLHMAPRATRVVGGMSTQEMSERPGVLQHYTSSPIGAEWKVHSNPPEYLRASPAFHLAIKAATNAWNRASEDPMARGVDVYLAWKYYKASLKQEERGSMAVRFALAVLNVQWSIRHFGVAEVLSKLAALTSPSASPPTSADSASSEAEAGAQDADVPLSAGAGGAQTAQPDSHHALQRSLSSLITMLRLVWDEFMKNAVRVVKAMRSWYGPLEDAVLYGAISAVVVGLLIRHHVA